MVTNKEVAKIFDEILESVLNDPKVAEEARLADLLYGRGSLTAKDLAMRFDI